MGKKDRKREDISLQMECVDEELSEAQLSVHNKMMTQYRETTANIDSLLRLGMIDITERGQDYISIEFKEGLNGINGSKPKPAVQTTPVVPRSSPGIQGNPPIILQTTNMGTTAGTNTYQLVMDPRTLSNLYVSSGTPQNPNTSVPVMASVVQPSPSVGASVSSPTLTVRAPGTMTQAGRNVQPRGKSVAAVRTPVSRAQLRAVPTSSVTAPALVPLANLVNSVSNGSNKSTVRIKPLGKTKATEANSVGGIGQNKPSTPTPTTPNTSTMVVDLTDDDGKTASTPALTVPVTADSREVMINKLSGKTYPSLVVVARPNLHAREITQSMITSERTILDSKMKAVLMGTPTKFTEWLIQQGLVRSEQYCSIHVNADMSVIKLKLGMYSDVSKFPYSGGYVWISECCPQRFVSVFSGSIFEGAPHAPTVLVKLLYHWACQTSVNNIAAWVKVDGLYVKSFFTNIRAVCTAAIHEKFEKLGGPRKRVELGVISLGTTSQDGNMRQVKVEVLGVYDPESKLIRLRAVEPLQDGERNFKRRFVKILEPLEEWVHKESIILTDFTVDKGTLLQMGYQSVYQVSMSEQTSANTKYSNYAVMDYLRRIVPRMFQNTLSLLSRQIIQQFLDELVWRERWGFIPARAFENMIAHLAEQTKLDTGDTLMTRLNKIASNPFKSWVYKNWQANCSNTIAQPTTRIIIGTNETVTTQPPQVQPRDSLPSIDNLPPSLRAADSSSSGTQPPAPKRNRKKQLATTPPATSSNGKLRPLDPFYYGSIPGDLQILSQQKQFDINMKCGVCQKLVKDNTKMMRHLIGHAYNEGSYTFSDSSPQCRYCLRDFPSEFALESHVQECHEKGSLACLICREVNRDRTLLILHMHHNHTELELPYRCGICHFRSSQHNVVVDHFYEMHKNTDKMQCPFCLKIVNLQTVDGRKITQNQYFFITHIQKHQRKTLARKCNKCVLWFIHKDLIKEHYIKDHASCRDTPGVERLPADGIEALMMPVPLSSGVVPPKGHGNKSNNPLMVNTFTINNFTALHLNGIQESTTCCECEGQVLQEDHFPGYLSCLRCRFATCCSKAMNEHFVIYHDRNQAKPQYNVGKTIILQKPLFCVCGFSSRSGNKLARHLATCKRKSAYPSPERAAQCTLQGQSASFPPLVTLDEEDDARDNEEKWMRAFSQPRTSSNDSADKPFGSSKGEPPSMLNMLGLVRKPSIEEASPDKPPYDGEVMEIDG